MTVPGEKDPGSLVALRDPQDGETAWRLAWATGRGEFVGIAWEGTLDELSEWAMANGFTGVVVRPPLH